jgi:tetratricopeptide (TPR) repeat protein
MTFRLPGVAGFVLLVAIWGAFAQTTADFDDLARRASEAIDSHPAEAAALYRQALGLRPKWAEGWLYLGASLFALGNFSESRDALHQGAALAPAKGTAWAFLGMSEYELGDYRQAIADIVKGETIGLADDTAFLAQVRTRAALAYLRYFDFPQALEQLKPLPPKGVNSPAVIEEIGISTLNLRFLPSTLPPAKRPLVELAGRAAWAFLAERPEEAGPLFEQLVARFPLEPGVHYARGVFLIDHDPAAAEQEFRQELHISPAHVLARVQLAPLVMKRGNNDEALDLARQAVGLDPADPVCHVTLGRALLAKSQTAQSIAEFETAVKLSPGAAQAHFYLQQAYRRAGRDADARKQQAEFDRLRAQQQPVTVPAK